MKIHIDGYDFEAEDMRDGILIDPVLPEGFHHTPNEDRPAEHDKFWHRPFVATLGYSERGFVAVCCLNGGAWDRPTMLGHFPTMEEAVRAIKEDRIRQYPELDFVTAAALGFSMKVERLRIIEGWAWAVDEAHGQRLADGIEPTRGSAKSAAARAVHGLTMLARRPAQWSARYDGDG